MRTWWRRGQPYLYLHPYPYLYLHPYPYLYPYPVRDPDRLERCRRQHDGIT
ncbi:hypothetical protein ACFCYH_07925 [Streptomyces sp. NPDC056400]|uniref:hypothetical protein n=1 Tax=Streptomyces sp. NPDC056400 TaxID=3345808 RepID=UPI0035DB2DBE